MADFDKWRLVCRLMQVLLGLLTIAAVTIVAFSFNAIESPAPSSPGSMGGGFVFAISAIIGITAAVLGFVGFVATTYFLAKAKRKKGE